MTKYPMWLLIGAAVIGVIVAFMFVIPTTEVPEQRGTAPSVINSPAESSSSSCAGLPPAETQRCVEEAQARSGSGPEPREAITSSNTSRAARGSGVEGVSSGGTTHAPPTGGR